MLGIKYDIFSHTSNHFPLMLELCTKMIKEGNAFVDDTDGETMKQERSERVNSKNRDNGIILFYDIVFCFYLIIITDLDRYCCGFFTNNY